MARPTPFDLVFQRLAPETFPKIRSALDQAGYEPQDRDRFLMLRDVVTLIRGLRPEEGLGEGIDQLAALVHHAYLYWEAGQPTIELSLQQLTELLGERAARHSDDVPPAFYVQVPERRVWAQVIGGQAHEPLDGCFVHSTTDGAVLRVLGIFGVHPEREGFSVVEAAGSRPSELARQDGTPLYAPTLSGGAAAGLFSLSGEEELLDFGWRVHQLGAGSWELGARSEHPVPGSKLPAPSS